MGKMTGVEQTSGFTSTGALKENLPVKASRTEKVITPTDNPGKTTEKNPPHLGRNIDLKF
jgi:hypothetical protein